ncbi:MAG: hypothetical protein ABIH03_12190 [Pseudomonadota bacterium]
MRRRDKLPHPRPVVRTDTNLDGLHACAPDPGGERLPQASHWVMHQEPERLNRLIREFVGA